MPENREKYLLAMGRAVFLASEEPQNRYSTTTEICNCKEFARNAWYAQQEKLGKSVPDYPGVICKHVLEAQIREGLLNKEDVLELPEDEQDMVRNGFAHQLSMVANAKPTGPAVGRETRRVPRKAAIRVTASDGWVIDFGNRQAKMWHFDIADLEPKDALAQAQTYFGEHFTAEVVNVSEGWNIDPLPVAD